MKIKTVNTIYASDLSDAGHSSTDLFGTSLSSLLEDVQSPLIIKGLVKDWPMVKASEQSTQSAVDYLKQFYSSMQVGIGEVPASENGRLFYNQDMSGFNFSRSNESFDTFIHQLINSADGANNDSLHDNNSSNGYYMGSTHVDKLLPGFRQTNDLDALAKKSALASIWISNQTRIAAHQDLPNNLACCVAGKRRFTLFPPHQIENLYIGPLDLTPAGQPISLVDINNPDFDKHPKFKNALAHAQVAELEAGDALLLPTMWWHSVESLTSFNILINYWWQDIPHYIGAPNDALMHALMNIKSLPQAQKNAYRHLFDYYIFNDDATAINHIPKDARGILDSDELSTRKMRAMLLNKLNR